MKKVLIVDDSPAELANMSGIIRALGLEPIMATSGTEAVTKAQAEKPSLILMDIVMPEVDGYEACRRLQADPATKGIPVVFVSSKNQKADQLWAKMQGGKALLPKPYTAEQITDTVKSFS